ncbi:energy transducer TonB [Phenylobacterium immobile]|uniref:energy transducer TonB n=1 Tax=Phenylobacterium immobile TaxID=21 RepID=UPI000A5A01FB|nr:energy transducer TonB [Phenylobacterium immobile]
MTDTPTTDVAHPAHNPFDERKPARNKGVTIAIIVSIIAHVAIGVYLWKTRFEPNYKEYSDEVTDVSIIKPVPPPPPPPPPPPSNTPPPPPPKLQPRPPVAAPDLPSTIPPLPVPPVEKRIEEPRPPAAPPPEAPRPSVITQPDWQRRPTAEETQRYYPERASRMNVSGSATLSCTVNARGGLENCSVVSETPADQDFGGAALRMSRLFRMRPQTRDGSPVAGGLVRVPIRFQMAD